VSDLDKALQSGGYGARRAAKYEMVLEMRAMGRDMKGLLVLTAGGLVAATALVYGHSEMAAAVGAASLWPGEPATLLLSGSVLLGAAGALRRCAL
jgi:TRAP-type C4-dicarboxylate transport system permease small subunit